MDSLWVNVLYLFVKIARLYFSKKSQEHVQLSVNYFDKVCALSLWCFKDKQFIFQLKNSTR